MSKHSHIEVYSIDARQMAEAVIKTIDKLRTDEIEKFIEKEIERVNSGFFHKLFRLKPYTRADVIREDDEQYFPKIYSIKKVHYGAQYELCQKIINASRASEKMSLSINDYNSIL
jgi:hypothetical protein